ncbi:hypothetical protein GCM10020000_36230 [Streptomyces olivoverticillatus]
MCGPDGSGPGVMAVSDPPLSSESWPCESLEPPPPPEGEQPHHQQYEKAEQAKRNCPPPPVDGGGKRPDRIAQ